MQGWISIHRQITENWVWEEKPFSYGQAWIDLLLMANHSENKFCFGKDIVKVETGSFVTSELKLMERRGWSKTKVRRFLDLLVSDGMIVKKTDHRKTTLSIVNYCLNQNIEPIKKPNKNRKETEEEPKKDINNTEDNDNTDPKVTKCFIPPTLDEVKDYCRERGNNVEPEKFVDFYSSKGWMVGKNRMKDWKAAVRTWERTGKEFTSSNRQRDNSNMIGLSSIRERRCTLEF